MRIEVIGPGCSRCVTTEKNVKEAVKQLGIQAEVVKITDIAEFSKKGIIFTPGVIVDGQVKVSGRIPTVDELKKILTADR